MPMGVYLHKYHGKGFQKGNKLRLGIHQTEEHRKKISNALRGNNNPAKRLDVRKKISGILMGHKHSDKTKEKIRIKHLGKKHSEETKRKISEGEKGRKQTIETKNKISLSKIGKKRKPFSMEWKQKIRESNINHPNRKFKDTSIELKIETELQQRNINYQKQVPLCKVARVDFYLPEYRIIIQCDGDYYHNLQGAKERAEKQDRVLTFNGFNVYRFWEHEINESPQKCIDKILL